MNPVVPTGLIKWAQVFFFSGKVILCGKIDIHLIMERKRHLINCEITKNNFYGSGYFSLLDCTSVLVLKLTPTAVSHLAVVKSSRIEIVKITLKKHHSPQV